MTTKTDQSKEVLKDIKGIASGVYKTILARQPPKVDMPLRALSNVKYDPKEGFFELLDQKKERTLTASTIKTFAQTLRMMSLSKELIKTDDIATKREAYYVSKNWGEARFNEQPESDAVMDDIEAMLMVNREQMGFIPEEKGGDVAGKLVVVDKDPDTGKEIKIDCTKMGTGAYSVPSSVEELHFETNAEFILAIETAGMYQRLVKHAYWKKANCILISLGGVPTRACRRFIRRLSDEKKLPVYAFSVDGNATTFIKEDGLVKMRTLKELMENRPTENLRYPFLHERSPLAAEGISFSPQGTTTDAAAEIIRHESPTEMRTITTDSGFKTTVTPNHSIIVFDDRISAFLPKTPDDIDTEHDHAIVSLDVPANDNLTTIDLGEYIKALPTAEIGDDNITNRMSGIGFRRFLPSDKVSSFCRLLGYYAAEGHLDDYRITWSFNADEDNLIEDVRLICKELFELETTVQQPHDSETQISIHNRILSAIFETMAGTGASSKRVPDLIFNVPAEAKKAFLYGYFMGDGRVDFKPEKSSVQLWAKTTSQLLAHGIVGVMAQLGGFATIEEPKEAITQHLVESERAECVTLQWIASKQKVYLVSIANKASLALVRDVVQAQKPEAISMISSEAIKTPKLDTLPRAFVKSYRDSIRKHLRGDIESILPPSTFQWPRISKKRLRDLLSKHDGPSLELLKNLANSKTTLARITKVEKQPATDSHVYDIAMAENHNFFTNFICVHNTDGDPYGWLNIYRTLKVGSGNAAHINKYFCVPNAKFFGITAQDIIQYKLPSHPLKDVDIKRVKDGMKNDPFVAHHKEWQKALNDLCAMKKRAEQQALAAHGLNFVISDYLPEKLSNPKSWLP